MSNLRVCHLGKYYPPAHGGIESHVRTLASAQAELGPSVEVLCVNHEAGPTRRDRDAGVEVTRLGRAAKASKLDVCPELVPALRRVEADVLHLHVPNPTMILALLRARVRTPLVVTYHSDVIKQKVLGALFRPLERLVYRQVRAILPTSPTYASGSSFLRPYGDRLQVLPHGIELAEYLDPSQADREAAETLRARHPGPLWMGCGRLVYYKGFVNAIRALSRVPGTLVLIGEGPERAALEAEAKAVGVSDRVEFAGKVARLAPYYLAADAFWFPSNARSEAFGLVQVEAMAAGCPVINTAIPHSGVAWVSRHDKEGLTVPLDDPGALADAANRLITEPGLRDRLAAAARVRAKAEFDHRVMARRSLDIYRCVLDGGAVAMAPMRAVPAAGP
ncbi:MAG: glycosyl transferase group 1 [Ramlibacter sp.]|nr:glycosyl transferase group 1 [Ramlibacter sp.]